MQQIYKHSVWIHADLFDPLTPQFLERYTLDREQGQAHGIANIDQWFFFYVNQPRDPVVVRHDNRLNRVELHPGTTRYIGTALRRKPKNRWLEARWITPYRHPRAAVDNALWYHRDHYLPLRKHITWHSRESMTVDSGVWQSLDHAAWRPNQTQAHPLVNWAYQGTNSGASFDQKQHSWCRSVLGETQYVIEYGGLEFTLNVTGTGERIVYPTIGRSLWKSLQNMFWRLSATEAASATHAPY